MTDETKCTCSCCCCDGETVKDLAKLVRQFADLLENRCGK
jgi:hypothetical protein